MYGIVTLCYILHYLSAVLSLDLGSGQPIIILDDVLLFIAVHFANMVKKVKVDHTRLPGVGLRSWSRSLAVSLQVTWVINPTVCCHYFPPGLQLRSQPLRGLLPISLLGEQKHDGCEQFAWDCYPTASRLRFEPGPYCAWVQHANHSATEPPNVVLLVYLLSCIFIAVYDCFMLIGDFHSAKN